MAPPPPPRHDAAASGDNTHRDLADYVLAALAGLAPPDGLRGRLARARPAFLDLLRVPVRDGRGEGERAASSGATDACIPSKNFGRAARRPWHARALALNTIR